MTDAPWLLTTTMEARYDLLKAEIHNKEQVLKSGANKTRHIGLALTFLFTTALISFFYLQKGPEAQFPFESHKHTLHNERVPQCPSGIPPPASPPAPVNLWASIDLEEAVQIRQWLEAPERGLNLSAVNPAYASSDNVIYNLEAYYPTKTEALAYLESPLSVPLPERYARVTIHHGAQLEPIVKDYLVGPLPAGPKTEMRELRNPSYPDGIPYNARGLYLNEELAQFLGRIAEPLADAMKDLFDGVAAGFPNDTLSADVFGPFSFDGKFRRLWVTWRHNTAGSFLQPVGFYQYVDVCGTDPSQWKVLKIVYNHQIFPNTESFLVAFRDGTLKRFPYRPGNSADLSWSSRKRVGSQLDLDHLPGPRSVSFAGLRFKVDRKLQYISWMGWGLYLGFDRDMGLSLWDIRMRNERIVYQLAPQEALAQYAGNDPIQSGTAWLDRFFGMGALVQDLLPGYDCPHEAVYLPAITHSDIGSFKRERAICIFEHDTGRPLTRHMGFVDGEFGAVKGYILTIRSISTVGNYDYRKWHTLCKRYILTSSVGRIRSACISVFDYMLHLDGTIEVRVSTSGYLQGGFWDSKQDGYGTKIHDTTMGSLHDHVINFKVDLDIAGIQNSLLHTSTSQEEIAHPWFDEDWGQTVIQQKITREYITNENDALLKYPSNFQGGYALVNQEKTNKWGIPRGYAIHPGYSPVHNTVVGSKRLLNSANWARYNLAVSVQKDSEPSSSSMWNANLPGAPVVDFHNLFDGENITQEDLVAWVNVGTHHLPGAEDSPNTKTNTAASSFFLTPLNYFDYDISIDSTNAILLTAPKTPGDAYKYDDYGVKPAHCVPEAPPPFEYEGMEIHDRDGYLAPPMGVEDIRKMTQMYHRILVEL